MLSEQAANNLKFFFLCIPIQLKDVRAWIKFSVGIAQKSGLTASDEIVAQLMKHLDDFLCIEEIYDSLDQGGKYYCETILGDQTAKWCFKFSGDNPYQAFLTLSFVEEGGDKKWLPPRA